MTEIDSQESNLEQRLRKHYQQRYEPPLAPGVVWARMQADLARPDKATLKPARFPQWVLALTGFLVARRENAFMPEKDEDTLMENITRTSKKQTISKGWVAGKSLEQNTQVPRRRSRRILDAAVAALVVASLLLGWFAISRWSNMQGNGSALYTYASQTGEYVYDSQWTPGGKHLMFVIYTQATNHYRYMVWDAATGKIKQTLAIDLPAGLIGKVVLDSSDGHYTLIRTTGATAQVWELKLADILTGQVKQIYQGTYHGPDASGVPAVAFSDDSKYVAFIGADERVHIWDIAAGRYIQITDALTAPGAAGDQWLMWSLDDKHIIAKSATGQVARLQMWSVQTGRKLLNLVETLDMSFFNWPPTVGNLGGLSPDGTRILTYNKQTGVMVERDSNTLKILHTFSERVVQPGQGLAVTMPFWVANGTRIFMQINYALYIWDATGKLISTISLQGDPQANIGVIPSGEHIALPRQENLLEIWDLVTGKKLRTIAAGIRVQLVSWSLDGKYLAINDGGKNGLIYNALTGQFLTHYQGDSASVSPDGKYVYTQTDTDLQKIVRILLVS